MYRIWHNVDFSFFFLFLKTIIQVGKSCKRGSWNFNICISSEKFSVSLVISQQNNLRGEILYKSPWRVDHSLCMHRRLLTEHLSRIEIVYYRVTNFNCILRWPKTFQFLNFWEKSGKIYSKKCSRYGMCLELFY